MHQPCPIIYDLESYDSTNYLEKQPLVEVMKQIQVQVRFSKHVIVREANYRTIQTPLPLASPIVPPHRNLERTLNIIHITLVIIPPFAFGIPLFFNESTIYNSKTSSQFAIAVLTAFFSHGVNHYLASLVDALRIENDMVGNWIKKNGRITLGHSFLFFATGVFTDLQDRWSVRREGPASHARGTRQIASTALSIVSIHLESSLRP